MTSQQLRNALGTTPFQPFEVHLADGRHVPVTHPEFVVFSPSGRTMIVYQPDDSYNVIDLLLVTDLAVAGNGHEVNHD